MAAASITSSTSSEVSKDFEILSQEKLMTIPIEILEEIAFMAGAYGSEIGRGRIINTQFPIELINLFKECGVAIEKLPKLEIQSLQETARPSDYIDFLKPSDLSHPIMYFKDLSDRIGVALFLKNQRGIKSRDQVIAIFQRYTGSFDVSKGPKGNEQPSQAEFAIAQKGVIFSGHRLTNEVLAELRTLFKESLAHYTIGTQSELEEAKSEAAAAESTS